MSLQSLNNQYHPIITSISFLCVSVCHCSGLQSVLFMLLLSNEAVDLANLVAIELGQVVGDSDQILVHHTVELGERVIVSRLFRLLHL